jgi:hypothetical protein
MRVELRCSEAGGWFVTHDDQYVVGFNGPHAYEWAVRRHEELTRLLAADVGGRSTAAAVPLAPMRIAPAR